MMRRIVIGISGASGAIYGVRLLQLLRDVAEVETHLVVTTSARRTIETETDYTVRDVEALADVAHRPNDIGASISSGSFDVSAMIVAPCSMKSLSGIANSYADNLLQRAADVTLKERRPLILAVRETPFHLGHLRLMVQAAEIGAVVMPPVPAFYHRPGTVQAVIDQSAVRMLDQIGLRLQLSEFPRWSGQVSPPDRSRNGNDHHPVPELL